LCDNIRLRFAVFNKEEAFTVSYVITGKCLGERYATCVAVCPVDCIHPGEYQGQEFMIIDPEECIDCGACLPECPIEAIVETEEESPDWAVINKDLTPTFKGQPQPTPRPANDPPRKPENKLRG
jgi:ferredoxin